MMAVDPKGETFRGAEAWSDGRLHLDFLRAHGLRFHHRVLDLGCGALRTGIHLVPYLQSGHYFGADQSAEFLALGRQNLAEVGLREYEPNCTLVHLPGGDFSPLFGAITLSTLDFAWSHSLFTHLTREQIRLCLATVMPLLGDGCPYYTTYNESEPGSRAYWGARHPYGYQDHVRFPAQLLVDLARELHLRVEFVCDTISPFYHTTPAPWQHKIVAFRRQSLERLERRA